MAQKFDPAPAIATLETEARLHGLSISRFIQDHLGISTYRAYNRWKLGGWLMLRTADELAYRLGKHPSEIWGEAWWQFDEAVAA